MPPRSAQTPSAYTFRPTIEKSPSKYSPAPLAEVDMLRIQYLLNPANANTSTTNKESYTASTPPTPASTSTAASSFVLSNPTSPFDTPSAKGNKRVKVMAAVKASDSHNEINYPAFELSEDAICLSPSEMQELARQHKLFQVLPTSRDPQDLIADFTRHIPYSSDKKSFGGKTGKDGFDIFEYRFQLPKESTEYCVMWDYNIGLVRITPFFKACKYTKTTPAKALSTNPGLKELAHSITGGSLGAQGYWMPHACARDLCATFCYDIRWALTPIFGPSFIRDCLKKNHPGFGKFRIDPETVRNATLQAQGWKTPSDIGEGLAKPQQIPRSVPEPHAVVEEGKTLPPRAARPIFRFESPFSGSNDDTDTAADSSGYESPEISPKTTYSSPNGWTGINATKFRRPLPTAATSHATLHGPLATSLLTQPRYVSWRPASQDTNNIGTSSSKRRRSSTKTPDAVYKYAHHSGYDAESESDSTDLEVLAPPPSPVKRRGRGVQVRAQKGASKPVIAAAAALTSGRAGGSRKYHAEDYRAAQWLIDLSTRDANLAAVPPKTMVG